TTTTAEIALSNRWVRRRRRRAVTPPKEGSCTGATSSAYSRSLSRTRSSLIGVLSQHIGKMGAGAGQARLHRASRDSHGSCDLIYREVHEVVQEDHHALVGRQLSQRGLDSYPVGGGTIADQGTLQNRRSPSKE